ncbi:MAG: CDP-diacylglycerol--serine O-phosphatidyltransferase [Bryobacteraceae bacterium]|nr:CDP-diacylglycerol--serine O-phosphatidyltransferase [Bryobacteraceae bacterium]MDW8379816.1 CDP-diacylglycerol--serine O-phosphatidyltransferase [Bryobacterales bacterium]
MGKINLPGALMDKQNRRPRRAAYALPTLFTAGNLYLGFLSILKSFEGSMAVQRGFSGPVPEFELAAKAIGVAVLLDGLDGRIARLTGTESDFGREMDSLADVITFGVAPAVLAFAWGILFVDFSFDPMVRQHLMRAGVFLCFLFLLCSAARLARFNVQTNPVPRNPGRPDRKYFVGVPTPASAGMVASVVYAADSVPIRWWPLAVLWLALMGLLSFLMVCTWRYRSFKDLSLLRPRSPLTVVALGSLIYLVWNYSQPVLLAMAATYVSSGIVVRFGGLLRRWLKRGDLSHAQQQAS